MTPATVLPDSRRPGRSRIAVLGVAALLGAGAANATFDPAATPVAASAETGGVDPAATDAEDSEDATLLEPQPEQVTVDEGLIRSVARQALLAQDQPTHLTNLDLIARDVLAEGPATVAEAQEATHRTLQGHGPGGPGLPGDTGEPGETVAAPPECPPTARACIDVDGKRAWLVADGDVTYGPVPVTTGRPGHETAPGTHTVIRHVRHDHSIPFDSPMPFSTYFTTSGIAFHEGRLDEPSHGCIHLGHHAAAEFFEQLEVGDEVVAF